MRLTVDTDAAAQRAAALKFDFSFGSTDTDEPAKTETKPAVVKKPPPPVPPKASGCLMSVLHFVDLTRMDVLSAHSPHHDDRPRVESSLLTLDESNLFG